MPLVALYSDILTGVVTDGSILILSVDVKQEITSNTNSVDTVVVTPAFII